MEGTRSFAAEVRSRGQITIPKRIRETSHLEEGQVVSFIPVGDSIIITPRRLEMNEARRQISKILRESELSLEELIGGIEEERTSLYREKYGKKGR